MFVRFLIIINDTTIQHQKRDKTKNCSIKKKKNKCLSMGFRNVVLRYNDFISGVYKYMVYIKNQKIITWKIGKNGEKWKKVDAIVDEMKFICIQKKV